MIDRFCLQPVIQTKLIRDCRKLLELAVHSDPAIGNLLELKGTGNVITRAIAHVRHKLLLALKLLLVKIGQLRLGIKRINMTRATFQEDKDTAFGPWRMMYWFRSQRRFTHVFFGHQFLL